MCAEVSAPVLNVISLTQWNSVRVSFGWTTGPEMSSTRTRSFSPKLLQWPTRAWRSWTRKHRLCVTWKNCWLISWRVNSFGGEIEVGGVTEVRCVRKKVLKVIWVDFVVVVVLIILMFIEIDYFYSHSITWTGLNFTPRMHNIIQFHITIVDAEKVLPTRQWCCCCCCCCCSLENKLKMWNYPVETYA